MTIDKIYVTTKPFMSVMFVGSDTQSTTTPYGIYHGAASAISVGFTSDTPPKVNTGDRKRGGSCALFAHSDCEYAHVTAAPGGRGGGGGTSSAPTVVITRASRTVNVKEVTLDTSMFMFTVTNSTGQCATATIPISYVGH